MCKFKIEDILKNEAMVTSGAEAINEKAYKECRRILKIMLQNPAVEKDLKDQMILIIPHDQSLTAYEPYKKWEETKVDLIRTWSKTRGAGAYNGVNVTAVGEENLIDVGKTTFDKYHQGYSILVHEFAHTIQNFVLDIKKPNTIKELYNSYKLLNKDWVDGPDNCYASTNDAEYFAQSVCAFFGCNTGIDTTTNKARNNGRKWLEEHDSEMYQLLMEVFVDGNIQKEPEYVTYCTEDGRPDTKKEIANPGGV